MKTFLKAMSDSPVEFSGLGLHSLEIESLSQVVNLFVPLYMADIPMQSLLRVMIEYVYLEIEIIVSFFNLLHKNFEELVILS